MYFVVSFGLLLFVYALYSWNRRNTRGHKLPPVLPGALPIIGHNHIVFSYRNDFVAFMKKTVDFCAKSGGVSCFYFEDKIYYVITDLEDAIIAASACAQKHYFYQLAKPLLGNGLVVASGPIFYSHRKILNPAFSMSVAYGFLDVFNNESRRLTDIMDGFVGKGPVDTSECFKNNTFRTSCITILGVHDEKDNDFINTYAVTINNIIETIRDRVLAVYLQNNLLFKFSSLKKKQDKLIKFVSDNIQETIDKKKNDMKYKANVDHLSGTDIGFKSIIDILLEIAEDGSLSDQEIKDELNTTAIASFETTSRQLVYLMVLMGTYPDIQEKIFQEVMAVVSDRDLEKEHIAKLVYTEAFIKECLRIAPAVNALPRYVDKDVKLKNYTLRAGANVIFLSDGIHRQSAFGTDFNEFNPERWLDKGKQLDKLHFFFGYGQRVCVGKRYAMVSMKVTLAHIVRKFKIKADFNKMRLKFDLVMGPESGHEITLERRN